MLNNKAYGLALIISVVGMIATATFHPTGAGMFASAEALERTVFMAISVHALALGSVWLSLFGLIGLSRRLGMARADVTAALAAFAMAVIGVICAASVSGFVAPELARSMFDADEGSRVGLEQLFLYSRYLNGAFAKFHVVASSVAILLWSVAMLHTRFAIVLAWLGFGSALLGLGGILSGALRMNVHGLMLVVLAQGIWMAWAGVILMRRGREGEPA